MNAVPRYLSDFRIVFYDHGALRGVENVGYGIVLDDNRIDKRSRGEIRKIGTCLTRPLRNAVVLQNNLPVRNKLTTHPQLPPK